MGLHSQGTCKPCAWFWKPQGCKNGAECRHCHLCSPEELHRRKIDKVSRLRDAGVTRKAARDSLCAKATKGRDLSLRVFFSVWKCSAARTISPSFEPSSCKLAVPAHVGDFADDRLVPTQQDLTADACDLTKGSRTECNGACESVGVSNTNPLLASEGSRLHGSGKCRPCSFFGNRRDASLELSANIAICARRTNKSAGRKSKQTLCAQQVCPKQKEVMLRVFFWMSDKRPRRSRTTKIKHISQNAYRLRACDVRSPLGAVPWRNVGP